MVNLSLIERCTEIEKANRILLEKMTNIMASQPNAGVNLFKKSVINKAQFGSSYDGNSPSQAQRSKSLNRGARQREYQRITNENEVLLKRLQEK
jgi:hypothetical protein